MERTGRQRRVTPKHRAGPPFTKTLDVMSAGRYAFAFIAVVLFGCASATYFTSPRDGSPIVVPYALAVVGLAAVVAAWYVGRYPTRFRAMSEGDEIRPSRPTVDYDE